MKEQSHRDFSSRFKYTWIVLSPSNDHGLKWRGEIEGDTATIHGRVYEGDTGGGLRRCGGSSRSPVYRLDTK